MFTKNYDTEYYMVNKNKFIKPYYIFHMLSDIMGRNAASYGASFEYHLNRNLVWVLVHYEIDLLRYPKASETLTVGTLPYSFKRMYGYRIYEIKVGNETIALGKAKFALLNYRTKQFVTPDQELIKMFKDAYQEPKTLSFDKLPKDDYECVKTETTKVYESCIDVNNHMNNVISIELAYNLAPKQFFNLEKIAKIIVKYKKEAFLEDALTLHYYMGAKSQKITIEKDDHVLTEIILIHQKSL